VAIIHASFGIVLFHIIGWDVIVICNTHMSTTLQGYRYVGNLPFPLVRMLPDVLRLYLVRLHCLRFVCLWPVTMTCHANLPEFSCGVDSSGKPLPHCSGGPLLITSTTLEYLLVSCGSQSRPIKSGWSTAYLIQTRTLFTSLTRPPAPRVEPFLQSTTLAAGAL
jgi:hypothetical protein